LTRDSGIVYIENDFQKNMQEELQVLKQHLERKRLKHTGQRETILEVFLQSRKHLTVEELHNLVKYRDPSIGLTTVYRTMKLFCECNLARANHFDEGRVRYEHQYKTAHHDHMICHECGETIEFVDPQIEKLQEKAARQYGFKMTDHRMEIYGICSRCQRGKSKENTEIL
jgi:Fur family transcriptional regulator, ferric uptake regulator